MTKDTFEKTAALTLLAMQIQVPKIVDCRQRNDHVKRLLAEIKSALERRPADLVVLPELSTIDYSRDSFDRLDSLAETLEGESVRAFGQLAKEMDVMIVFGLPTCRDQRYFISQVVLGADGRVVDCFDKLHTAHYGASMEKDYFTRGERTVVFSCCGFTLAPIICYDIRFPELARTLTLEHNIDVLLHCGAYYRDESFGSWHPFVITRAMENQIYVVSLNRAGEHYGNSLAVPPWIDESGVTRDSGGSAVTLSTRSPIRFDENAECLRWIEVDRSVIDATRREYTFLDDRHHNYK